MRSKPAKVVILYEELAAYFIACVRKLNEYSVEVHIVHKKVNSEAPFEFKSLQNTFLYDKDAYDFESLMQLISDIKPDMLFVGGWMEKKYLKVAKKYFSTIPTVLGFDTKWDASFKQRLGIIFSSYYINQRFSNCFVPGEAQRKFALKLGFKKDQIRTGAYSADTDMFNSYYSQSIASKRNAFPKRFLYMARYIQSKGIEDLWQAFIEIQQEEENEWELWCLGTGNLYERRIVHPKIRHFGFIQPNALGEIIRQTGVFVLPSRFEPWGVVLHEFATAAYPLICSNEVGAGEAFLIQGENGYFHEKNDIHSIKEAMKKMMNHPDELLLQMGEKSRELSGKISTDTWAKTLIEFIDK